MRNLVLILTVVLITGCARSEYDYLAKVGAKAGIGAFLGYNAFGSNSGKNASAVVFGTIGALYGLGLIELPSLKDLGIMSKTGYDSLTDSKVGVASAWHNPETGSSGSFTPETGYLTESGVLCRNYKVTLTVNGKTEMAQETACRNSIGSWEPLIDSSI